MLVEPCRPCHVLTLKSTHIDSITSQKKVDRNACQSGKVGEWLSTNKHAQTYS